MKLAYVNPRPIEAKRLPLCQMEHEFSGGGINMTLGSSNDNASPVRPLGATPLWFPLTLHDITAAQLRLLAQAGVLRVDAKGYALTHLGRVLVQR